MSPPRTFWARTGWDSGEPIFERWTMDGWLVTIGGVARTEHLSRGAAKRLLRRLTKAGLVREWRPGPRRPHPWAPPPF